MNSNQLRLVGVAMALLGAGVAAFVMMAKSESPEPPPKAEPAKPQIPVSEPGETPSERPVTGVVEPKATLDRVATDRMRARITQSLTAQPDGGVAARGSDPAPTREPGTDVPILDKDYIQARIKEDLVPVAIECYESALEDDPGLAGKIVMTFAILGDPEVGGVVDEAGIVDSESTLASESVRECMRESMMAVNFDAPPDGGRVEVTYPFVFAPD